MTSPIITKRAEDPTDICSICQDGFEGEKWLTHFQGEQHLFHPKCFLTWMDRQKTCPQCRVELLFIDDPNPLLQPAMAARNALNAGKLSKEICEGDPERVRAILYRPCFSDKTIGYAVVAASTQGRLEILRELLLRDIPSDYMGMALNLANGENRLIIIQELLRYGNISTFHRGMTVWLLAQEGDLAPPS